MFILFYYIVQLTWGFFQNAFAFIIFLLLFITGHKPYLYHGAIVTPWPFFCCSMGIGFFVFYGHKGTMDAAPVLVHEYGHTIQSMILGPLYLFVIGIPSCIWAFTPYFQKLRSKGKYSYYDFYPEKWANYLGSKVTGQSAPQR